MFNFEGNELGNQVITQNKNIIMIEEQETPEEVQQVLPGNLLQLQNRERKIKKQRKIKIDVGKTEYPLLRDVASNELGWRIWTRVGKIYC